MSPLLTTNEKKCNLTRKQELIKELVGDARTRINAEKMVDKSIELFKDVLIETAGEKGLELIRKTCISNLDQIEAGLSAKYDELFTEEELEAFTAWNRSEIAKSCAKKLLELAPFVQELGNKLGEQTLKEIQAQLSGIRN